MIYSQVIEHNTRAFHFIKYPDIKSSGTSLNYIGGWTSFHTRTKSRYNSFILEIVYDILSR